MQIRLIAVSLLLGSFLGIGSWISAPNSQAKAESLLIAQSNVAVGAINPNAPVRIEVVNAGGATILCRLTLPATDERTVEPGESVTFGSLTTSYLPLPINFLAYPEDQDIGLSLYVTTEGNNVKVVVAEARSDLPGTIAMNVGLDGGIYLY